MLHRQPLGLKHLPMYQLKACFMLLTSTVNLCSGSFVQKPNSWVKQLSPSSLRLTVFPEASEKAATSKKRKIPLLH